MQARNLDSHLPVLKIILGIENSQTSAAETELAVEAWKRRWANQPKSICLRPALYTYLHSRGDVQGAKIEDVCPRFRVFGSSHEEIDLDVRRVVQIQYLFSGPGEQLASRFGHTLMRIIVCNTMPCDPMNRDAINVGFAAETDSGSFSMVGGVSGKYPAQLNFIDDFETRTVNLQRDFRNLTSAPLILDAQQRSLLFYLLVERYWTYSGHYKFLTNNCASEVLKLLRVVYSNIDRFDRDKKTLLTPGKLLGVLKAANLVDVNRIETLESQRKDYEKFLANFSQMGILPSPIGLKNYCTENPGTRNLWLKSRLWNPQQKMQWKLLETMCFRRYQNQLSRFQMQALWHSKQAYACNGQRDQMKEEFQRANRSISPQSFKRIEKDLVPQLEDLLSFPEMSRNLAAQRQIQKRIDGCASALTSEKIDKAKARLAGSMANLNYLER